MKEKSKRKIIILTTGGTIGYHNTEDGLKDKLVVEVISYTSLLNSETLDINKLLVNVESHQILVDKVSQRQSY